MALVSKELHYNRRTTLMQNPPRFPGARRRIPWGFRRSRVFGGGCGSQPSCYPRWVSAPAFHPEHEDRHVVAGARRILMLAEDRTVPCTRRSPTVSSDVCECCRLTVRRWTSGMVQARPCITQPNLRTLTGPGSCSSRHDVNARTQSGETPLFYAMRGGEREHRSGGGRRWRWLSCSWRVAPRSMLAVPTVSRSWIRRYAVGARRW